MKNYWKLAQTVQLQTSQEITGGFSIGFDKKIPEQVRDQLMDFVYWVEDHYMLPVTVWVDFLHRHYLVDSRKKRVGYKFYWAAFENYPTFEKEADIPVIELPVRLEKQPIAEVLSAFIQALTLYYAWMCNDDPGLVQPDPKVTESILQCYFLEKCHD